MRSGWGEVAGRKRAAISLQRFLRKGSNVESLAQVTINGLAIGLAYTLLALGFTLIFSIMGVVNVAHGDLYMLGGFMTYYLFGMLNLNYALVIIFILIGMGALGMGLERGFFRRLRGQPFSAPMILSLGLLLLIEGLALVIFGEREKGVQAVTTGVISIGGISFGAARLVVMVVSILLLLALFYFVGRVKIGQGMRALAQDAEAAYLQGIDINRMSMLAFAIGVALAGVAGSLLSPISFISYSVGSYLIMKCFVVVVVGGLGSMPGCLVGGLILGFVESFSLVYLPSDVSYLLIFTMVLIILLIRPQGIMGRAEIQ